MFSSPNFHFGTQFLFWKIMLWVEIGGVDSSRVMGEHQFCQFMICNRNICAHHSVTGHVLLLWLRTAYFKAEVALSENCVCSICWLTKFNFARFGSWCELEPVPLHQYLILSQLHSLSSPKTQQHCCSPWNYGRCHFLTQFLPFLFRWARLDKILIVC